MRRERTLGCWALGIGLVSAACEKAETSTRALTATSSSAQSSSAAGGSAAGGSAAGGSAPGVLAVCERPESVHFDAASNAWYVSCMAKPDVAGDGFIAKLNAAGDAVVSERFSTGLNEPKGIRIRGGKLFVSDVTELVTIDVATGRVLGRSSVVGIHPDASSPFLNDVAVSEATGDVYASDNRNDALYRFNADGGSPRLLVKSPSLEAPNGLLLDERPGVPPRLLIAAMGPGLESGRTDKLGAVLAIALSDLDDGDGRVEVTYVSQRIGNLDGIEFDGGDLLVTDTYAGRLLRVSPTSSTPPFGQGDARIVRQGFARSADLGFDPVHRRALVPQLSNGTVVTVDLGPS